MKSLKLDKQQLYMRNIQISKQTLHDCTCKKDSSRTHFARAHVRTCVKIQVRKTMDLHKEEIPKGYLLLKRKVES